MKVPGQQSELKVRLLDHPIIKCTAGRIVVLLPTHAAAASSTCPFDAAEVCASNRLGVALSQEPVPCSQASLQ